MSSFYGNSGGSGGSSSIKIDNTLTKTGQAADAKKTGDEITNLKNTGQFTSSSLTLGKDTINQITITTAQLSTLLSLTSAEGVSF